MSAPFGSPCIALIDIGNTRLKIGWLDPTTGQREPAALALEPREADTLGDWFKAQNVWPTAVFGVNVAGAAKAMLIEQVFRRRFEVSIAWQHSQQQACGVHNNYRRPQQLGADRWAAMIGLSALKPNATTPLLLANFGTATTLDTLCPRALWRVAQDAHAAHAPGAEQTAMHGNNQRAYPCPGGDTLQDTIGNAQWVYEGGLIFPGPALMRASLAHNTAQLPRADGNPALFPVDTHTAIVTGIAAAQAGAVIRQWQAGLHRYGVAPRVYCTGGGWPVVQQEVQSQLALAQSQNGQTALAVGYLPAPILDGLARMAVEQHHRAPAHHNP